MGVVARLTREDRRAVTSITHALEVWNENEALAQVMPQLAEVLRARVTCAYGLTETPVGFRTGNLHSWGVDPAKTRQMLDGLFGKAPRRYGYFDPDRPEPYQRDRSLTYDDLVARGAMDPNSKSEEHARTIGIDMSEQLRVLVCDGPSLVSLVAAYRPEPWRQRERGLLTRLVPALRRRLLLERTLSNAPVAFAALDAAMEEIPGAAFLVTAAGEIVQANAAGRTAFGAGSTDIRRALRADVTAPEGAPTRFRLTRVAPRGAPLHFLAVARSKRNAREQAAMAATRWSLSPRQASVLAWLAEGVTNARIGAELGISERTVEIHVTSILVRAQCASRSALVAAIYLG